VRGALLGAIPARVRVVSQDGVDVLLLGQGGRELVDGVLAVDMWIWRVTSTIRGSGSVPA